MSQRLVCVLVLSISAVLAAPEPPSGGRNRLRTDSELVLINATVLDKDDRFVTDVRQEQVRLYDEGVRQRITLFAVEDVPVSVAIVCDVSGSMKRELPHVQVALARLSESAKPGDEYLLITTSDEPTVSVPFTSDPEEIEREIAHQQAAGSTALIDGIVLALHEVKRGSNSRKAVLVLSDGMDNHSRYSLSELRSLVREAGVPIYAFTLDKADFPWLTNVVQDSGGRTVLFYRGRDFPRKLEKLDVHRQYVIGFVPQKVVAVGKYRRVKLELADNSRKLRVYWRRGYYAAGAETVRAFADAPMTSRDGAASQ